MTKVSVKDKVEAVMMYENGETLKVVANKFKTSIPLVHYWKKNKEKLLKELEWSIPSYSNSKTYDNSQLLVKEELKTSPVSVTSQNENNQNIFLENQSLDNISDNQDEIENNNSDLISHFTASPKMLALPLNSNNNMDLIPPINNNNNNLDLISTNNCNSKTKRKEENNNNFFNQFTNVQQKLNPTPLFSFPAQFTFQNQFQNSHLPPPSPVATAGKKSCKINQTRHFISGLSKVQQLQLQEYHSLKNVYDTQMETGEKLKDRQLRDGNNSSVNSLSDEIEEYNKVINSDLFIKIIERLEYLETALFYQI